MAYMNPSWGELRSQAWRGCCALIVAKHFLTRKAENLLPSSAQAPAWSPSWAELIFINKCWPHIHIHRECCDQITIRTQKSWESPLLIGYNREGHLSFIILIGSDSLTWDKTKSDTLYQPSMLEPSHSVGEADQVPCRQGNDRQGLDFGPGGPWNSSII